MTASAASSSSTARTETLPKSPDVARRHYVGQFFRRCAELRQARADGADEALQAELAEALADARTMARRARSWGQRSALRSRLQPAQPQGATARKRARLARTAPITGRDVEIQEGTRLFHDPDKPGSYFSAPVNRRVDILAAERAANRITESQLLVGRMIQVVYERGSGARLGSVAWGEGGSKDQTVAHELAIIFSIEDAEKVKKFTARVERAIGTVGARFLRQVLTERVTFAQYAAQCGKSGEKAVAQVAAHFRFLLEGLTEAQHTAQGTSRVTPDDQYAAAARSLVSRTPESSTGETK